MKTPTKTSIERRLWRLEKGMIFVRIWLFVIILLQVTHNPRESKPLEPSWQQHKMHFKKNMDILECSWRKEYQRQIP